jgi:type II secretory pathway pseudopilin PulG
MPFLSGLWAKLLAVLAVVGTVALAVVKLLGAGAAKQQARQQQAEIAGGMKRRRIEEEVSRAEDPDLDDALRSPDRRGLHNR